MKKFGNKGWQAEGSFEEDEDLEFSKDDEKMFDM